MNKTIPFYSGGRCHRSESFKRDIKNSGMKGNQVMIDLKVVRLQYVERILAAMDSEFALGEDGSLWVNDGQYQIILPDRPTSEVLIRFSEKFHHAAAANIGTIFSGIANPMGLNVRFTGTFDPDCDSTRVVLIQDEE